MLDTMRHIDEIIIHCTATKPMWWYNNTAQQKVDEVRRWHTKERGWSDIGYHVLIDRRGEVVSGRPLYRTGAHVVGHNTGTIGISLFGGFGASADDKFSEHFTPEQDKALRETIAELQKQFPTIKKISGHNDYARKGCPGFTVQEWLKEK